MFVKYTEIPLHILKYVKTSWIILKYLKYAAYSKVKHDLP